MGYLLQRCEGNLTLLACIWPSATCDAGMGENDGIGLAPSRLTDEQADLLMMTQFDIGELPGVSRRPSRRCNSGER